ncbi:MAG TPA: chromosome partitioning protein ParB [Gammaproteobacteria bacterium]|nr:ParB/RepB/Spo0J family partition protein [Gammaproteobacteria bacterium]HAY41234.1 chromosome partitioning protein ParB [Gammaproteobacteria bacterium]|tara:strand:+ start:724 stop:1572 length:849 start_codon:yes stop_codon:yes gene_type:complete
MAKNSKLGRGLDILLGQTPSSDNITDEFKGLTSMNVKSLKRGKFQPRDDIDNETLKELASSITSQGVIQPLVVRNISNKKYEIIAGERRWRAAKIAKLKEVPVIVRDIDDKAALAISLIENIQRESLTAIEEAKALSKLIEDFKMTHEDVSHVVGRSRSSVSNLIRLLHLTEPVKKLLGKGEIEMGHARALLPLKDSMQMDVALKVINRALSVRQTEDLVKRELNPKTKKIDKIDPKINKIMGSLSKKLNSKTEIKERNNKGKIIIHFNNSKELNNILNHIN